MEITIRADLIISEYEDSFPETEDMKLTLLPWGSRAHFAFENGDSYLIRLADLKVAINALEELNRSSSISL